MAFSPFRLFRGFRSICLPISAVVCFSLMLTYVFVLYQPSPGPGIVQRLGWQSWDTISLSNGAAVDSTTGDATVPTGTSSNDDTGVDWWNVTSEDTVDYASLPLDVWAPLLPHDTGLSEIAITRCLIDPGYAPSLCAPDTTPEKDAIRGNWVRVGRNINLEGGYLSGYLNIYYRRPRRQDINLVTDIRLLPKDENLDGWHKAETSLRSGVVKAPPLYLWYKLGKTAKEMSSEEKAQLVTEIDVLYGDDVPWYGFEKLQPATLLSNGHTEDTWLTFRRGVKQPPRAPPLHFSRSGKFKILQVADLHYSVSKGYCRDVDPPCKDSVGSDNLTNTWLGHVMDIEKPDMIVFTGDQLNGQGTSWDPKSVLAKFAKAAVARKTPWAAVFGNHDSEVGLSRDAQMDLMKGLPYNLVDKGPKDVHGIGNYMLKVMSADASKTHLLSLYFLDSGDYSDGFLNFWGVFTPNAYDYIRQNQIDWFLQQSASVDPIERPFSPDTAKDMGDIWQRQSDQLTPLTSKLAKPNALMFFHIPLPESYSTADIDARTGQPLDVGIHGIEGPGNSKKSDGFFEKGILKAMASEHTAQSAEREVKVIANGHCHLTENCRRVNGVWLCFGGGGSYSGYGKIGFDRRFRIYEVSDYGETIKTWKRTEKDEIIDVMVLAGKDAAPI